MSYKKLYKEILNKEINEKEFNEFNIEDVIDDNGAITNGSVAALFTDELSDNCVTDLYPDECEDIGNCCFFS